MATPRSQVKRQSRYEGAFRQGRDDGFRKGWDHGYWYGRCESLLRAMPQDVRVTPVHVLFVATGKGFPYSPLDESIAETLRALTARLSITTSNQPVAEVAARLRPDVVIVLDGLEFDTEQVDEMRRLGIRTVVWFTDDPYYTDITSRLAPHYDDIFTLERTCVDYYRALGCNNVHYLPLGVDPASFRPLNPPRGMRREISFVGSAYWRRVDFFNQITGYLATKDTLISGIWWERLRDFAKLEPKIALGRWMDPAETAHTYNGAQIVINMHRAHDDETFNNNSANIGAVSPNPRTFEISACGTLQLTDIREDLPLYYTPDVEIITYASPEEMVEKIDYYLNHEQERQQIALRGLYRTMRDHTYAKRLETMLSILFG
ncbi:conserved hypothetical protein [Paenibacillus curdlanolyticus YK9]|uniref:Spore protein YkvP/CgeB glycosyl transferase-like domain-containing protein n=1 Tax=Paenibacillus curdlanolyticus YK9 TaxID=717606 RepID=E0IFI1_9BACL|nr:glycosyltransferase [Paenibacillus curdlanolyticus]EFM08957.1 conserved hypothetical protein [Paenibacillus curdlanolyticus YK9]